MFKKTDDLLIFVHGIDGYSLEARLKNSIRFCSISQVSETALYSRGPNLLTT